MKHKFPFTIIALDDCQEIIDSLLGQDLSFEDNVQLIVTGGEDLSLLNKYPDNVIKADDLADIDSQNVMGEYVGFASVKFEKNYLFEIYEHIQKHQGFDLIRTDYGHDIDLDRDFRHPLLKSDSTFIKCDMVSDYDCNFDVLLNERLLEAKRCSSMPLKKSETLESEVLSKLIDFSHDPFIQYGIVTDLADIIVSDDSITKKEVSHILDNIDIDIIKKHDKIENLIKKFMVYLKTDDFHYEINNDKLYLKTADVTVNGLHGHRINIDIVDIRQDNLHISGVFRSSCDPQYLDYYAVLNYDDGSHEKFKALKYEYEKSGRARVNYLGVDWKFISCFDFKIPLKNKEKFRIDFEMQFHQNEDKITLKPKLTFSRLCYLSKYCSYFSKNSKIVMFKDNCLYLVDDSFTLKARLELKSMFNIIKSGEKDSLYSIFIRIIYWIMYPFYANRRIWIFLDRVLKADDNGEHLFRYAIKQDDGIKKYFVLDRTSDDFDRMRKISKNVVELDSFKYKLLCMYGEKYISSHNLEMRSNPFYNNNLKLFSNLPTSERCFLQHGVTIHDISHWLIKYRHNFLLIVTASDLERDSMCYPNLKYDDEVIQTLGFPRFDNLSNEDLKRQILFVPTWRKSITNDEEFLNSNYYRKINGLFNNADLNKFLKENNFRIMFKPHWNIKDYVHLLDVPPEVSICIDTPYQELINQSMILITDYSSVFFDFAYLKKPIIYYGRDDEYHNKTGYFDFESMGFGDIIDSEDELIDKIRQYSDDDFKMEDEYEKRVDGFFKFTDKDNCRRVYDWLFEN